MNSTKQLNKNEHYSFSNFFKNRRGGNTFQLIDSTSDRYQIYYSIPKFLAHFFQKATSLTLLYTHTHTEALILPNLFFFYIGLIMLIYIYSLIYLLTLLSNMM